MGINKTGLDLNFLLEFGASTKYLKNNKKYYCSKKDMKYAAERIKELFKDEKIRNKISFRNEYFVNNDSLKEANKILEEHGMFYVGGGMEAVVLGVKDKNIVVKIMIFQSGYLKTRQTMRDIVKVDETLDKLKDNRFLFFPKLYAGHLFITFQTEELEEMEVKDIIIDYMNDKEKDKLKDKYTLKLGLVIQEFISGMHFDPESEELIERESSDNKRIIKEIKLPDGTILKADKLYEPCQDKIINQLEKAGIKNPERWMDIAPVNFIAVIDKGTASFFYIDTIEEETLIYLQTYSTFEELIEEFKQKKKTEELGKIMQNNK